ncbi:MAG: acyltransferase domain-containing protein, partial [Planctomycetaceae bacterium]|nr:acyltransferase domain-containing protein [Planctomycetaceae bacterium]
QTAYTQPALFALEYALAELWQSWGIRPDVVLGHSVGEYVAACVAGVFSLEEALQLIATRGKLMQALPVGGAMVAVMAAEKQVHPFVAEHADTVSIAAINGPQNTVMSGDGATIEAIVEALQAAEIRTLPLQVSHAFHSPLMAPMLAEFERAAAQVSYHKPHMPIISNVTGERAGEEMADAAYWLEHVLAPVRFANG